MKGRHGTGERSTLYATTPSAVPCSDSEQVHASLKDLAPNNNLPTPLPPPIRDPCLPFDPEKILNQFAKCTLQLPQVFILLIQLSMQEVIRSHQRSVHLLHRFGNLRNLVSLLVKRCLSATSASAPTPAPKGPHSFSSSTSSAQKHRLLQSVFVTFLLSGRYSGLFVSVLLTSYIVSMLLVACIPCFQTSILLSFSRCDRSCNFLTVWPFLFIVSSRILSQLMCSISVYKHHCFFHLIHDCRGHWRQNICKHF